MATATDKAVADVVGWTQRIHLVADVSPHESRVPFEATAREDDALACTDPLWRTLVFGDDADHVAGIIEHELARGCLEQCLDAALEQAFEEAADERGALGTDVLFLAAA